MGVGFFMSRKSKYSFEQIKVVFAINDYSHYMVKEDYINPLNKIINQMNAMLTRSVEVVGGLNPWS